MLTKRYFTIDMCDSIQFDGSSLTLHLEGKHKFETREEARSMLASFEKVAEAAGIGMWYRVQEHIPQFKFEIGERVHFEHAGESVNGTITDILCAPYEKDRKLVIGDLVQFFYKGVIGIGKVLNIKEDPKRRQILRIAALEYANQYEGYDEGRLDASFFDKNPCIELHSYYIVCVIGVHSD